MCVGTHLSCTCNVVALRQSSLSHTTPLFMSCFSQCSGPPHAGGPALCRPACMLFFVDVDLDVLSCPLRVAKYTSAPFAVKLFSFQTTVRALSLARAADHKNHSIGCKTAGRHQWAVPCKPSPAAQIADIPAAVAGLSQKTWQQVGNSQLRRRARVKRLSSGIGFLSNGHPLASTRASLSICSQAQTSWSHGATAIAECTLLRTKPPTLQWPI